MSDFEYGRSVRLIKDENKQGYHHEKRYFCSDTTLASLCPSKN